MRPFGSGERQLGWPSSCAPWQAAQCCAYTFAPSATFAASLGSVFGGSPQPASNTAAALRTRRLDRSTDFSRRSKHDRCAIPLHPGADHHRLAGRRPELARVGLEAQVELPDLLALAVRRVDGIRVAAVSDRGHLSFWRRFFQIELARLHPHHPAAFLLYGWRLEVGRGLEVDDQILARLRVAHARERHAVAWNERLRIGEPPLERGVVPGQPGALEGVGVA